MASNCSFRITRTTEDLAQTITALSERLIKLEQRFEAMELQFNQNQSDIPVQEIEMLDGIDQQLKKCKALLDPSLKENMDSGDNSSEQNFADQIEIVTNESEEEISEQIWIDENKEDTMAA